MLNIIIPMAGLGDRFIQAGFERPKPLIDVCGKTMIERAIDSLKINGKYIFIVRKYENPRWNKELNFVLNNLSVNKEIIQIDYTTGGAACTAALAEPAIDNNNPVILSDCDRIFGNKWNINKWFQFLAEKDPDFCPITYDANTDKNSYVACDDTGKIIKAQEKQVISRYSTTGVYYWKHAKDLFKSIVDMIQANDRVKNEFYISHSLNYLIKDGKVGYPYHLEQGIHNAVGVPADLAAYVEKYYGRLLFE